MPTVEEKIAKARANRDAAEALFRDTLREGRDAGFSWHELGEMSGLSLTGVRYLVLDLNARRRESRKGESNGKGEVAKAR